MIRPVLGRDAFGIIFSLSLALLFVLCDGLPIGAGGLSQFEQQLHTASLLPFTEEAQSPFPVVEQWYFVEGITSSGIAFAYLNTVASYEPERSFSALRPVFGSSSGSVCTYGKPLGRPFLGSLTQYQNRSAIVYEGEDDTFFGVNSDGYSFFIDISDERANLTSSVTAFGPLFAFQYTDTSLPNSPRSSYVQVLGKAEGQLNGESFTGWGGVEYHRGHQSWGTSPPFADFWYRHWVVSANLTDSTAPSYSLAIVESNDSGFHGGYQGVGSTATLVDDPEYESGSASDCGDDVYVPLEIELTGFEPLKANTRIAISNGFWWVGRIADGLFGWWEIHMSED